MTRSETREEIYARVLGRDPDPGEITRARAFLARYAQTWRGAQHGREKPTAIAAPVSPPER